MNNFNIAYPLLQKDTTLFVKVSGLVYIAERV